jgi:hypothetical protein
MRVLKRQHLKLVFIKKIIIIIFIINISEYVDFNYERYFIYSLKMV